MQPLATKHHGHNIPHIHHEVLCDYTHRLNKEYNDLPIPWREYFLVRINNLIKHSMRWNNVFNIVYDPITKKILITGFPTYTLKRTFKISIMQTEYTLHKMDYKQAIIYIYGKNYVRLEFLPEKRVKKEPCVLVKHLQHTDDLTDDDSNIDCNILTTDKHECECCCCKNKEETTDGNGTSTTGNTDGTDGNNQSGDNNGDTDTPDDEEGIIYP